MKKAPLISCICITRNRPQLLSRAIACFKAQSYPNKELVIQYETDDLKTFDYLSTVTSPEIKIIALSKSSDLTLGSLRNEAIRQASGEYICQWDDDDWYHPERLNYQYKLLEQNSASASVLGHFVIFDTLTSKSYLSCFRQWEGSLLCKRSIALECPYPNLEKGEDTPVIQQLQSRNLLFTDTTITPFYHYIFHGNNTWDYNHFTGFFRFSKPLSNSINEIVERLLLAKNEVNIEVIAELDKHFESPFLYEK